MPEHTYPWKRFWYRRGDPPDLSDMGYLRDPDAAHWPDEAPRAVAFDTISDYPCLVLLGEPGLGKTTVLKHCHEQVAAQVAATGDRTLLVKLGMYGSEDSLYRAIFEAPVVHEWERGAHHLYLFLDGLDETLMNMRVVVGLLAEQLPRYSAERLYLRITCRSADWPSTLEQAFRHHWEEQQVGIFEMAPLRRADVVAAAQANNLDPGTFLHAIDRVGAVPFANRPITLRFLLNSFKRDGRLPPTKQALYEAGCEQLCEEQNPDRRDAGLTGNFTGPQRLAAAERIAAVTVFTQHKTVWMDIDRADVLPEDIPVRDLGRNGHTDPRFTEPAIHEALSTALFTSHGERRLGWAHQRLSEKGWSWGDGPEAGVPASAGSSHTPAEAGTPGALSGVAGHPACRGTDANHLFRQSLRPTPSSWRHGICVTLPSHRS